MNARAQATPHSATALWVNWDPSRRSSELAAHLGARLVTLRSRLPYVLRALVLGLRTLWLLGRRRPALLVVQNPSIVLAGIACAVRPLFGYMLVVDRHSNFKLATLEDRRLTWRLFHLLSRYTVRAANLTIVTNADLARRVARWGGRPFVLPDKLPALARFPSHRPAGSPPLVVFPASHDRDEPVGELVQAARLMPEVEVAITGSSPAPHDDAPPNVRFTGYLDEQSYQRLLSSADAVLALTTAPQTLLCCAYEALALAKPLVVSDQEVLIRHFSKGRVKCENTPAAMAAAVREALQSRQRLAEEAGQLAAEFEATWNDQWQGLVRQLAPAPQVVASGARRREAREVYTR